MSAEELERINTFKQSQDYIDICYMIDHAPTQDVLSSCIEELGYSIGLNILVTKDNSDIKNVIIGKDGEFRIQSSYKAEGDLIVECVICKRNNI